MYQNGMQKMTKQSNCIINYETTTLKGGAGIGASLSNLKRSRAYKTKDKETIH